MQADRVGNGLGQPHGTGEGEGLSQLAPLLTKAERREDKRRKRREMGVSGHSVKLLQQLAQRRADKLK